MKILVVEDDLDLNFILCKMLKKSGYTLESAYTGAEAQERLSQKSYDLLVLDLMLPEISGEALIGWVRQKQDIPILVISAKSHVDNRVEVLDLGADDYLVKPFEQAEVIARVNALLRRSTRTQPATILSFKNIKLDLETRTCGVREHVLVLTAKEFELLRLFLEQPQKVYPKAQLYEAVWGTDYLVEDNALNVHISNLRKKLKIADPDTDYIETVWGLGFKLKE